jgi:hypothetical protein
VDGASDNKARTKILKEYINSADIKVKRWAYKEAQVRSSSYDLKELKPIVVEGLKDKDEKVRVKAVLVLTRIYDSEDKHGLSRDVKLFELFIDLMSNDKSPKVREAAFQQLASHSRKRIDFEPDGKKEERESSIKEWKEWLATQKDDSDIFGKGEGGGESGEVDMP